MQATPSNAIQNNQRLFVPFSRKLASDDQAVYAAFAEKFAVWLSDERAYYEEARPEILKLLKIAQTTLRRNVGANPDLKSPFHISSCIGHPMVASYSRLLRAVHPYKDRFLESDLQEIKSLLKTIAMPVPTRIVSNDLTTEPHPPIPEVTVTPKVTASTSRQRSTPTPAFAPLMRSSLSSNIIESGPGRSAVGLTRSHFNSAATFDGKTISPLPYVTDDSVEMTQYTTDLLAPAAAPVLPRKVAVSRAPSASFGSSKEPERGPSSLSTPAHDAAQTRSLASIPIGLPTPPPSTSAVTSAGEHPALSKPRKKKKKKLNFGLESLIQADLQELQKRGVAVKQELTEATIPMSQKRDDVPTGMTMSPQPEVIVLDHDDVHESLNLGEHSFREVDSNMAVDELGSHSSLVAAPLSNTSPHMGDVIETVHSGNDMVVDETTNAPSPMYDERQAGAIFEHLTSGEDIDMADGITKTITLDESPPQNAQVASSLVRQMDGLASTDVNIATHSTSHSVSQPTTSANMDIDGTVLDISPAAPDASMVAENKNVRFQTRQLSLPQRGQMAAVGVTSAYTAEQISPGLEGGVLEPSGTQNLITTPTTTLPPSVTGATHQHPLPPATHSLMPKTWSPLPSKPNSPLNSPIVPSRAGSTSSRAASVIGDPLLPRTAVYPTLINDADHPPVSPSRKALESMVMNSVLSTAKEPSERASIQSGSTPSAHILLEHGGVSKIDALPPMSMLQVKVHSAEELTALHAFGPGTATFAIHKGLVKKSKASIRFDIPEEQFNALTVWRTRKDHTRDLKDSLCLSLSCYSRVSVKTERKTLEEVSALPSVWPSTGDLFMNVMYDGKKTNLPLSPPFIVAPNGLVDVSDFLNLGLNTIELDQFADMSGYIFILRAHHPTGAQLEQVAERRRKDQAWKDWLYKMSQPFDLPIPPDPLL